MKTEFQKENIVLKKCIRKPHALGISFFFETSFDK